MIFKSKNSYVNNKDKIIVTVNKENIDSMSIKTNYIYNK